MREELYFIIFVMLSISVDSLYLLFGKKTKSFNKIILYYLIYEILLILLFISKIILNYSIPKEIEIFLAIVLVPKFIALRYS